MKRIECDSSAIVTQQESVETPPTKKQRLYELSKSSEACLPNDILVLIFKLFVDDDEIISWMTAYVLSKTIQLWQNMWKNVLCMNKYRKKHTKKYVASYSSEMFTTKRFTTICINEGHENLLWWLVDYIGFEYNSDDVQLTIHKGEKRLLYKIIDRGPKEFPFVFFVMVAKKFGAEVLKDLYWNKGCWFNEGCWFDCGAQSWVEFEKPYYLREIQKIGDDDIMYAMEHIIQTEENKTINKVAN